MTDSDTPVAEAAADVAAPLWKVFADRQELIE
jgi:hypothetical protein